MTQARHLFFWETRNSKGFPDQCCYSPSVTNSSYSFYKFKIRIQIIHQNFIIISRITREYNSTIFIKTTNFFKEFGILYIEKDFSINEEIDRLRLKATTSLIEGRNDVIIVASVSCIYGIGAPDEYANQILFLNSI